MRELKDRSERDSLVIGVDASRNRSGGARAYLIALFNGLRPQDFGIARIHLWAPADLLAEIADHPALVKHSPPALERSLPYQLAWQAFVAGREARALGCDLLFTTDASTASSFQPMVTFSQDLLAYEPGVPEQFGWGSQRLRLIGIRWLQNRAFRRSMGVIFLTRYTARVIQQSCGTLDRVAIIPHGVGDNFRLDGSRPSWPRPGERPVDIVYVSNTATYKHQWVVVEAIGLLRAAGHDVRLTLIGGGEGPAQQRLERTISTVDPTGSFVTQLPFIPHADLPAHLEKADLFVFASSCEAFGITLLEAMAAGVPTACSDRSSLPEILRDGGVYFDPENAPSIAAALELLIRDPALRQSVAGRAREYAREFTWQRCAAATWQFVVDSARAG